MRACLDRRYVDGRRDRRHGCNTVLEWLAVHPDSASEAALDTHRIFIVDGAHSGEGGAGRHPKSRADSRIIEARLST